jgi:type IV pilus assembly protein PilF
VKILVAVSLSALFLAGCAAPAKENRATSAPPELERTIKPTPTELAQNRAKAATELAAGWFQRGQYGTALEELESATKAVAEFAPAHGLYGLVYHAMREDTRAEESFKRALALAPNDPELRTNYGWFLCRTQREVDSVLEFEKAADNPLYRTPTLALQYAAQCAARGNKMFVAETFYKRMAAIEPDSAVPYFGLVEISYRVGKYVETRNHLRVAMRSAQVPPNVLHYGVCAENRLGDKSAADVYLTQLKNRYPSAVETLRAVAGECD